MIAGYHYINLARRKDRDIFMRYTLAAMNFEEAEICRFDGINGSRYKNKASIARAAAKEFKFLGCLETIPLSDFHGEIDSDNPCDTAIQWTWCRLLKQLSQTLKPHEYALCGTDEINLTRRKSDFRRIIDRLPRLDMPHLDILQVCWAHANPGKLDAMPLIEIEKHPIDGNMRLIEGVGGIGDQLLMLNREGARRWLNWIAKNPTLICEIQPALKTKSELIGFYATPNTDEFYSPVPTEIGGSDRIGVEGK